MQNQLSCLPPPLLLLILNRTWQGQKRQEKDLPESLHILFFFFFVKMRKKLCRMNNRVYNSSTVTSFINLMYNSLTNVSIPFETKKDPKSVILIGYITYQNFYITYVQWIYKDLYGTIYIKITLLWKFNNKHNICRSSIPGFRSTWINKI